MTSKRKLRKRIRKLVEVIQQAQFFAEGIPYGLVSKDHPEVDPQWGIRRLDLQVLIKKVMRGT